MASNLVCPGHTRPVVHLDFSDNTDSGYYLLSACKGKDPAPGRGRKCVKTNLSGCLLFGSQEALETLIDDNHHM